MFRPLTQPRIYLCTDVADYRDHQHLLEPTRGLLLGGKQNLLTGYSLVLFEKPVRFNLRLEEQHHYELSDLRAWTPVSLERVALTPVADIGVSANQMARLMQLQQACLTNVQCFWRARDRNLILNKFTFFEPTHRDRFRGTDFDIPDHWAVP